MPRIDTVVIGAGHAGLAVSRCLAEREVPHVVLDRGHIGERWRTDRWDGFRMLTPNWLSRLPGWAYAGPDPDGFTSAAGLVEYLVAYAGSFGAPVLTHTHVLRVQRTAAGFAVLTNRGRWTARNVVVATGYHSHARVPGIAAGLSPDVVQVTTAQYRSPAALPGGAVLVVGASASGVQIAHDILRSGQPVLLAVGTHTRLPRRYRGRDILWWLDRIGALDRTVEDAAAAVGEPSLQLAGGPHGIDLGALQDGGVRLTGRLRALTGTTAVFADDLSDSICAAQARLDRTLATIDRYAAAGWTVPGPPDRPAPIGAPTAPSTVDLRRAGVAAVVWATGYRPRYPWLAVPVLDRDGRIRHRRGVTDIPGLYAIGLRFQYRRNSTFVDGARHDATYLVDRITAGRPVRSVAMP
jgi:putative flavoprotein involved in K+ transport